MSDFSARLFYSPCLHLHLVTVTTGSRRFSQGEVTDDIQERLQCLDCLEYVSEPEVRAVWSGKSIEEEPASQLGDDFEQEDVPIREEVKEWQQQTGRKSCSIPHSLLHKRVSAPK